MHYCQLQHKFEASDFCTLVKATMVPYTLFSTFQCKLRTKTYHTSHDSVSVVRTTFKVYGKRQTLTLSQPKTPEPIVTKFEWRDYVMDHQTKFGLNLPKGFCSPHRWNIHPSCLKFTTLFLFFNSSTGESVRPIFMLNTSNDAVLRKEVPF